MERNSSQELDTVTGDDEDDFYAADHRSVLNRTITIFCYVCIHVVCLVGNSIVLIVLGRDKRRRTSTSFFLCNLAAADLAVGLFCTGQHAILILVLEDWVFGHGPVGLALCKIYGFVRSLSYFASINILMLVATERFLAIVHPFTSRMYLLSPTTLKWSAFGAWSLSSIISLPSFIAFNVFHHKYNMTNPVTKQREEHEQNICHRDYRLIDWASYDIVCFVLWYLVPCVLLAVLYFIIGRKLWRSTLDFKVENSGRHVSSASAQQKSTSISPSVNSWSSRLSQSFLLRRKSQGVQSSLSSDSSDQSNIVQNRRKVIKMLVIVVVLFMVCWLPIYVRKALVHNYGIPFVAEDDDMLYFLRTYFIPFSDWMTNLHSACNPALYVLLSETFRAGVKNLFVRRRETAFQLSHPPAIALL